MLTLKSTILTSLLSIGLIGGAFEGDAGAKPAATTAVKAKAKADAKGPRAGGNIERICNRLECTSEQRTQLQSIGTKLAEESKGDRQTMKSLKSKLAAEFAKDAPNKRTLAQLFADMDQRQDSMQSRTQAALLEVHAVLTPAQRVELAEMIERRGPQAVFGGKGHKGHMGGKGKKGGKDGKQSKKGKDGKQAKNGKRARGKDGKQAKGDQLARGERGQRGAKGKRGEADRGDHLAKRDGRGSKGGRA
ncbi:MAG: periplasmic heavy metal sensor [Myxococcales bacterium]|nr:periplasmic heavy metal sensor [Myxococcales bacterium]